jgi:hypothetical protein
MNKPLLALVALIWSGAAAAQTGTACLFTPVELAPFLGHTPRAGVTSTNRQGSVGCQYGMEDAQGIFFWVRVADRCDRQGFQQQAKTRQSASGKTNRVFSGLGDDAYYSPGGSAAARVGSRCVELSGLRAGAKRVITEAEVRKLLTLAVSRLGR